MIARSTLLLTATIQPGATARASARPQSEFRPERLCVSPHSFPLPLARRAWTWPLAAIGRVLVLAHRGLAKLLRVDLHAARVRREYVSDEYAQTHEVLWGEEEGKGSDGGDDRPYVLVPESPSRRERLLAPLGRASRRLSQLRLNWQQSQLATLTLRDVRISGRPQPVEGAVPPAADPLSAPLADAFANFGASSCAAGCEIEVEVHNGSRRKCRLLVSLVGTCADDRPEVGP